MRIKDKNNALPITNDFTQAGVYARRKFSGNLEVYRPCESFVNHRLCEVANPIGCNATRVPCRKENTTPTV